MKEADQDSVKKMIILFFILIVSSSSHAGALLELGGTYLSDSTNSSSTTTSTEYLYQLGMLFNIRKKIWGGWNYSGISQTEKSDETDSFASVDTGPYFKWEFGKNEIFNLGLAYNILSRATFKTGSTTEKWEGTSFWIQFGVMPEVKEGLHIGASVNYFAASYTKKTVESIESTDSNSKTWIFPMLSLTKQW